VPKKIVPTRVDIKDKIGKLKINRQRLDLRSVCCAHLLVRVLRRINPELPLLCVFCRQLQISSRSLAVQSKIKANEAELIKLVNHLENTTPAAGV